MEFLKMILIIYVALFTILSCFIIAKFLIFYTFSIGTLIGVLLFPVTVVISVSPIFLIAWFTEK
jgi:hypothetical protein